MSIRGIDGVLGRIQEIKGRIEAIRGQHNVPLTPFERTPTNSYLHPAMQGRLIGPGNKALQGAIGNEPFNPMAGVISPLGADPDRGALQSMAEAAAARHGLDAGLFKALVQQESAWNPRAVSPAGAQGLTQLMPGTARMLGVADPFDPAANLDGGARFLSQMLKEFNGDTSLALAAYNAGPGAVRRYKGIPPFTETQNYVRTILGSAGGLR